MTSLYCVERPGFGVNYTPRQLENGPFNSCNSCGEWHADTQSVQIHAERGTVWECAECAETDTFTCAASGQIFTAECESITCPGVAAEHVDAWESGALPARWILIPDVRQTELAL